MFMNGLAKKILIFVLVMIGVAAIGWFGRKAYRRSTERRLIAEANHYLKTNEFRSATLCLRRALQINPMSLQATKVTAEMLEKAGVPGALGWRIRAAQLEPDDVTNRFVW